MHGLGLVPTGGSRLRDQMNRLFRARISISDVGPGKRLMQDITPVRSQRL